MEESPFSSLLRQYMSREAVPEGCFVPSQERCKLEDKSNTACTQVTQAVVHKRGMVEKQALTQSGRTCDLNSYIASAVQVRLNGTVEAFSKYAVVLQALSNCLLVTGRYAS